MEPSLLQWIMAEIGPMSSDSSPGPITEGRGEVGESFGLCAGGSGEQVVEDRGWVDFRDQCRRQMQRPMEMRLRYGFCRMRKPVLDDAPWRVFDTMGEYRAWCAANLPAYLGFRPAVT